MAQPTVPFGRRKPAVVPPPGAPGGVGGGDGLWPTGSGSRADKPQGENSGTLPPIKTSARLRKARKGDTYA